MASKKAILKLLMTLSMSSIALNAYASDENLPENKFCIHPQGDIKGRVLYNYEDSDDSHTITTGESFGKVSREKKHCIVIQAERQLDSKNHENINWVKQHMPDNLPWKGSSFGSSANRSTDTPNALNFAIHLTSIVYISNISNNVYTCENVILAQGSKGIRNNWWIVSNSPDKPNALKCTDQNGNIQYLYMTNGDNPDDTYIINMSLTPPKTTNAAAAYKFW